MKRMSNQFTAGQALVVLGLCLALAPGLQAADSDLSTSTSLPSAVSSGQEFTVTVGYSNAGPDEAVSAYPNSYFVPPVGLDIFIDNTVNGDGSMYDALAASAEGTDTLGNVPGLFFDDNYCEEVLFQNQGDNGLPDAAPVTGLTPGASGTFNYSTTIPMEDFASSTVTITEPSSVAASYFGNITSILDAASKNAFSRGSCEKLVGGEDEEMCSYIFDNCFGARVSQLDVPLDAEFELVNDGTANPTLGCEEFVDFTPGNIAVLRRGDCQFGTKAFNAEQALASAVFMVNSNLCGDFPESDQCVLGMLGGDLGGLTTIPTIQVAQANGEPVIAALEASETVRGIYGDTDVFTAQTTIFLSDAADTDPDETNDDSFQSAAVSAIPDPPVASFTYSPAAPTTGSPVMFTDTSTGAPASWAWNFGDGGSSTEQNPSYSFASAGTFTVMLTATNAGGSSDSSMDVSVVLGADLTESYFIPAAALASGDAGAFFQTDVDLNNSGSGTASYAFLWLPRDQNNPEPTQSETFQIAGGASFRYVNILAEVFGLEPNVAGALAIISNAGDLKIMSRTYNVSTAKVAGTFGQALPGVPAVQLIGANDTQRIIFMSENDDLRANLGCVNGVNDTLQVSIDLYSNEGAALETVTMNLGPWANKQINKIFEDYAPINGYADVRAAKANAGFYCYGSVLDNGSSDPTSVLPTKPSTSGITYIPAAALIEGTGGAFFQTDIDVNNTGAGMATFQFMYFARGEDGTTPVASDPITLDAGKGARYENVLANVFGLEPGVAGAVGVSSDTTDVIVMSRTYSVPSAKISGTFGQALPGIPEDMLMVTGEKKRIIFMTEDDAFRANLGCINGTGSSVGINIELFDSEGASLETKALNLAPFSNNQINKIFKDYKPVNGYADVWTNKADAKIYCYGSVVDNASTDPTTILPQ